MSSQSLLGNAPANWTPKFVAGTVMGACIATALFASTTSSSLYVAPTAPAVAQATGIAQAPFAGRQSRSEFVASATPESEVNFELIEPAQTASWAPLAAVAAVPLAILGAVAAFRTKKDAPLDPMDMMAARGTHWSLAATAGETAVGQNYASALIALGLEKDCLEQLFSDVENLKAIKEDEEFAEFFNDPVLEPEECIEVLTTICGEQQMSDITKDFLCFLVESNRFLQLDIILKEFVTQYYEATGTQLATVTAASPLSEEELREIANKLHEITKGKNIKIKAEVDEELIAGFILEFGKDQSQRIDFSLRGQIAELEEEMQEGIRSFMSNGVPVAAQLLVTSLGINALLAGSASAGSGNIFDFGLTMPIQMIQFLLLMVFLEKVVFTPVGKIMDERAEYIRSQLAMGADNSKEIAAKNAEAEMLLNEARKDAAKALDQKKKEAATMAAKKMEDTKAKLDSSLQRSLKEIENSREQLWAKMESEVLPELVEDIVTKLMPEDEEGEEGEEEEPVVAAAAQ